MKKIAWLVILLAIFWLVLWGLGAYDKYPELALPLFFIYAAVIAPHFR